MQLTTYHLPILLSNVMHEDDLQQVTLCYVFVAALRQTNPSFLRGLALTPLWLSSAAGCFHFHLISAPALMLLALHQMPFVPVSPPSHIVSHREAAGSAVPFIVFALLFPNSIVFFPSLVSLSLFP